MPKYRYILTAEVEVTAPNVMAAEVALKSESEGIQLLRRAGIVCFAVKMPSGREGQTSRVRVSLKPGVFSRLPLRTTVPASQLRLNTGPGSGNDSPGDIRGKLQK
jgi:hypothetical protein